MKKVNLALVIFGVLLILISAFLNYSSQYEFANSEEETIERFETGIQHPSWYVFNFFTAILFGIGFFANGLGNKITFYILLPVFAFLGMAFALIQTITWGATPFVPHYEFGMTLQLVGCLVVILATILSLHRPKPKKQPDVHLLDQN